MKPYEPNAGGEAGPDPVEPPPMPTPPNIDKSSRRPVAALLGGGKKQG